MASADELKSEIVDKVLQALENNISLKRLLDDESVEITRLGRLLLQIKVEWNPTDMPHYYTLKVSEPW